MGQWVDRVNWDTFAIAKKDLLWDMVVGWFVDHLLDLPYLLKYCDSNARFLTGSVLYPGCDFSYFSIRTMHEIDEIYEMGEIGIIWFNYKFSNCRRFQLVLLAKILYREKI